MLDARDRTAAGTNFENINHRDLDRQRLFIAADQSGPGDQWLAVYDYAGLRRGAAHVEGDCLTEAKRARDRLCTDHTGGWSGFEHPDAFGLRSLGT